MESLDTQTRNGELVCTSFLYCHYDIKIKESRMKLGCQQIKVACKQISSNGEIKSMIKVSWIHMSG